MNIVQLLTTLLKLYGNPLYMDQVTGRGMPIRSKIMVCFTILLPLTAAINTYKNWENIEARFSFLENLITITFSCILIVDFICSPSNYERAIGLISSNSFQNNLYVTKYDVQEMLDKTAKVSWTIIWIINIWFILFWFIACGSAAYENIVYLVHHGTIDYRTARMPYPALTIMLIDNFPTFFFVFVAEMFILAYSLTSMLTWINLQACTVIQLYYELDLLCQVIERMDEIYIERRCHSRVDIDNAVFDEIKLKGFLSSVYKIHLVLIRKTLIFNKSIGFTEFMYNQLIGMLLSMELYCLFQVTEMSGKAKHAIEYITAACVFGAVCSLGQSLINMSEKLWMTISTCSWQNKPLWFKHSIRLLLIGSNRQLDFKPLNLYILDFSFFLRILQISYSYFNIMLQVTNKKYINFND